MKNLTDYIKEQFETEVETTVVETEVKENEIKENEVIEESEESIESEEDFRAAAKAKFEEAFGDDLDEKKMNDTIDGLLKDNDDLVKDGKWGELMGMLNKSFGK